MTNTVARIKYVTCLLLFEVRAFRQDGVILYSTSVSTIMKLEHNIWDTLYSVCLNFHRILLCGYGFDLIAKVLCVQAVGTHFILYIKLLYKMGHYFLDI